MANVYNLYNKYIHVNGRWERLNDPPVASGSASVLNFQKSMTAADFLALNLNNLEINSVYNVLDEFTTDSRFLEGPGTLAPEGTFVAVIHQGTTKYFNILGSAFNMDYIQKEIMALLTIIDSMTNDWEHLENKPFTSVGEGLDVDENDALNAKALIESFNAQITEVRNLILNLANTWSSISNKPFSTIGDGLSVDENDALNASIILESINDLRESLSGIQVAWNNITGKPFNSIGDGLTVINGALQTSGASSIAWNNVTDKPFNTLYSSDFTVYSNQLRINSRYNHYEISSYDMQRIKAIIES